MISTVAVEGNVKVSERNNLIRPEDTKNMYFLRDSKTGIRESGNF